MKKVILAILCAFFLLSCSKDKEEVEILLKVSESDMVFLANSDSRSFKIESNSSWEIHEIPDWLKPNFTKGNGNMKISVSATSNPKEEERAVTLKIRSGNKEQALKIKQLAKNVTLALTQAVLEFEAEPTNEGLSFDIVSNEKWTISALPEWCQIDKEQGDANATVTIIANKNYVDSERSAILEVKAGGKTEKLAIKQKGLNIRLYFTNDDFTSSGESALISSYYERGIFSVVIGSNTKWTIHPNASWYSIDKLDGIDNQRLTISVPENTQKDGRKDVVTIKAGSQSIKLYIAQSEKIESVDHPHQINMRDNAPRIGDNLVRKLTHFVEPGNGGENVHWSFTSLITLDDNYEVSYLSPPITSQGKYIMRWDEFDFNDVPVNSLIVRSENYTWYYMRIKDNTLQTLGYENPVTQAKYDPRMTWAIYAADYNIPIKQDYKGKQLYSGKDWGEWEGYADVKTDGYGSITLPCGTYANAIRVKRTQTLAYDGYINDIPSLIKQTYTSFSWYVKGYRYPIFETHRVIYDHDNSIQTQYCVYFPPKDHTYLNNSKQVIQLEAKPKIAKNKSGLSIKFLEYPYPIIKQTKEINRFNK